MFLKYVLNYLDIRNFPCPHCDEAHKQKVILPDILKEYIRVNVLFFY